MSAKATPTPKHVVFDPVKLQSMTPPLTVRIERVKGNVRQSMPMPRRDGYAAPGQGFVQDEVMEIEQWTVSSFGGGTYAFTITDSSNPPELMTWTQVWNEQQYPPQTPAPLRSEIAPQPPVYEPAAQMQGAPTWAPTPFSNPFGQPIAAPPGAPSVANNHQPWPPFSSAPSWGYPAWGVQQQPAAASPREDYRREAEQARLTAVEMKGSLERLAEENRRLAAEAAKAMQARPEDSALKQQLEREREERHKAELAAQQAAFKAELAAITAQLTANKGPSDAEVRVAALEAESRRKDEERRREDEARRDREAEARQRAEDDRRRSDELKAIRDESQAAIAAANARTEAILASINAQPKVDPMQQLMMQMLLNNTESAKEQARLQAETARETARIQADAAKDRAREQTDLLNGLKTYMMSPIEVARMIGDASQGQHQFVGTMTKTFSDAFGTMRDTYRNMMEAMQGPGESPVLRVIEGGVQSAKEMFERWNQSKATTQVAAMNAQRDVATAQAAAMRPIMPHEQRAAQAPQPANGNGNGNGTPTSGWQPPPPVAQQAPQPQQAGLGNAVASVPVGDPTLRKGGRTDAEWFGDALPDVLALREGIIDFIGSVSMNPPRIGDDNRPIGIGPDQAALVAILAAQHIMQTGLKGIPAFEYLFQEKMYDALMDIILPDGFVDPTVASGFRTETLQYLYQLLNGNNLAIPMPVAPPIRAQQIANYRATNPTAVSMAKPVAKPTPRPQTIASTARAEFPPDNADADLKGDDAPPELVPGGPPAAAVAVVAQPRQPVPVPAARGPKR